MLPISATVTKMCRSCNLSRQPIRSTHFITRASAKLTRNASNHGAGKATVSKACGKALARLPGHGRRVAKRHLGGLAIPMRYLSRAQTIRNMECTIRSMRAARNQVAAVFAILAQASATIPLSAYLRYGELTDSGGEDRRRRIGQSPGFGPAQRRHIPKCGESRSPPTLSRKPLTRASQTVPRCQEAIVLLFAASNLLLRAKFRARSNAHRRSRCCRSSGVRTHPHAGK